MRLNCRCRWLMSLPLYHAGGLAILFRCLQSGAGLVVPRPERALVDDILHYQVTHVSLVPTQLERMLGSSRARQAGGSFAGRAGGWRSDFQ